MLNRKSIVDPCGECKLSSRDHTHVFHTVALVGPEQRTVVTISPIELRRPGRRRLRRILYLLGAYLLSS